MTNDQIKEIVDTVYQMMTGDVPIYDPNITEIAQRHTGKPNPPENMAIWRDALPDIRDELAEHRLTQNVHLVSQPYYEEYRHGEPSTLKQARDCICAFQSAEGVRIPSAEVGDLIYTASLLHNAKCGTGKTKKAVQKGLSAANSRELSTKQLETIVTEGAELIRQYYHAANELERRGRSLAPLFDGNGMPQLPSA